MNLFFVFNPKAGKEKIKQKLGDIIELFSNNGHTVTVHATTCQGDACEKVKNLPDGVYLADSSKELNADIVVQKISDEEGENENEENSEAGQDC